MKNETNNMKNILICLICGILGLCINLEASGQNQPGNSKTPSYPGIDSPKDGRSRLPQMDIRERLVQLAMQNPAAEIDDRNLAISQYTLQNTKSAVLNNIVLQGNLNEYSIQGTPQFGYYPRYNIGATLPLGLFLNRSRDIKVGEENVGIAHAQKTQHSRELRQAVLAKYEDYLMATDLLNLQKQLVEDVFTNFQKVEKNFAEAKVQSEDYTNAYREYNNELAKQRTLERNLKVTVLELERYIGVKLEDVLNSYK
jgi:outer membrane protein TolC